VSQFQFQLDAKENELIIRLTHRNGIKRAYVYNFETQLDVLNVEYNAENYHHLEVKPKLFISTLDRFDSNLEEIRIIANRKTLTLRSFVDLDIKDHEHLMQTEFTMDVDDFDSYALSEVSSQQEASSTFVLKYFRAMLQVSYCC
jgi:hypothetical protein